MRHKKLFTLLLIICSLVLYANFTIAAEASDKTTKSTDNNITPNQILQNNELPLTNKSTSNSSIDISNQINAKMEEVDAKYTKIKLITHGEYLDRLDCLCKRAEIELHRIWQLFGGVAIIISIIGVFGFNNLKQLYDSINEAKRNIDKTNELYKKIGEDVFKQSIELREKYGYLTDPNSNDLPPITPIDENRFLDYDHQLYFMPLFIPVTKDFMLYKESLLKLGIFFVWQRKNARAILRFEEIERISEIEHGIIKYDKQILKGKTDIFFNAYGNACANYADENCVNDSVARNLYLNKAETYYKKAIEVNPYFFKPYYNLGIINAVNKNNPKSALNYYKSALKYAKKPDDIYGIKWNTACSLARLDKPVNIIIEPLRDIPEGHAFWAEIQNDKVLDKIKNTPEWRILIEQKAPKKPTTSA